MVRINWTRQAIEDIHEIREYYKVRSAKFTEQLTDKIFEKGDSLQQFPKLGRMVPELHKKQIRELIYLSYRIIYRIVSDDKIDILSVHSGLRPLTELSIFE